jgi:hypothetical protein
VAITIGVAGASAAARGLGEITDNKELKDFSKDLAEIGLNGIEAQN